MDLGRSNGRDIWLRINNQSGGKYKCQVVVEGTFNSVSAEKRMDLVSEGAKLGEQTGSQPHPTNGQSRTQLRHKLQPQQGNGHWRTGPIPTGPSSANSAHNPSNQQPVQAQQKPVHQQNSASPIYGLHLNSAAAQRAPTQAHLLLMLGLLLVSGYIHWLPLIASQPSSGQSHSQRPNATL